jgi:sarcosine oxidase subunit beta
VALYDVTPDWAPIYDKSALGGYFLACGTSGNQFKNGGVVGMLMAELILAVQNGLQHDTTPFQFPVHYTNVGTINTGAYSRLRTPMATSASVLG